MVIGEASCPKVVYLREHQHVNSNTALTSFTYLYITVNVINPQVMHNNRLITFTVIYKLITITVIFTFPFVIKNHITLEILVTNLGKREEIKESSVKY